MPLHANALLCKKKVLHMLSQSQFFSVQCLFCGGKKCALEDYKKTIQNADCEPAINGLNSHWITSNIVASQRPSTRLLAEFLILHQFKSLGIVAVFNLQEPGEHPKCGDGITKETGFSYNPEEFMQQNGINFNCILIYKCYSLIFTGKT